MSLAKSLTFLTLILCANITRGQTFVPGNTYFDATGYVEYRAGNLPIILSAPHGGSLEPATIPDRDCSGCSYVQDSWTKPITEGMYDAFFEQTGCYPHVIINLLHRKKFDANRDIDDAADGDPTVEQSWANYHAFIDAAKTQVVDDYGRGLFLDIHGHAHTIQRIEMGYLLSGAELRLSDATLNTTTYIEESSIRTLVGDNLESHTHAELLRGDDSFGTLMDEKGFPSVPSFADPFPDVGEPYFSGGYNTVRHGSRDNAGEIDAIQLELNQDVRFNAVTREILIDSLTRAANQYIDLHYNNQYLDNYCSLILPVELLQFTASKDEHQVILSWATSSELNNAYFDIERSLDGVSFKKIGQVRGSGNSIQLNQYRYLDNHPQNGMNYYRLKQMDYDGQFAYSDILSIKFDNHNQHHLRLYPNPSPNGKVVCQYISPETEDLTIAVYDVAGKLMLQQTMRTSAGENQLKFDFSALNEGIYVVKIGTMDWQNVRKVVIE